MVSNAADLSGSTSLTVVPLSIKVTMVETNDSD